MRFSLPFAVILTCIIAPDWYRVHIIQRCMYILFTFSLFLTERFIVTKDVLIKKVSLFYCIRITTLETFPLRMMSKSRV